MAIDRRTFLTTAAGIALVGASPSDAGQAGRNLTVKVTGGLVAGGSSKLPGVAAWLGIPYAQPPVGPLRWRSPQPVEAWTGMRLANRFSVSPCAMPPDPRSYYTGRAVAMGEDCLTINIWAPTRPSSTPRPVVVWIYGGAFVGGTSDSEGYDGSALADQGVVFVSFNYRVGILGFFAHPELAAESSDGVSGNYGLRDQVEALRWIRTNISAFGGDSDNITIMGQSAGAFSVAFHLVIPSSRGLFHRAIVESGAPMGPPNTLSMISDARQMEVDGVTFAKKVGAANLADLRGMDAMALVHAYAGSWNFNPALDGVLIPEHPLIAMRGRRHADVPLIVGFNHDEGNVFPPFGGGTPKGLDTVIAQYYRGATKEAQAYFAPMNDQEAVRNGHEIFGDLIFNWNTATLAEAAATHGRAPVYFYNFLFDDVLDPRSSFSEGKAEDLGAFHGAEIGYALRTAQAMKGRLDGPRQRMMTDLVSGYWLNLALSGNPNGAGLPGWPRYVPGTDSVLHINAEKTKPGPMLFRDRLALLSKAWEDPST